MAKRKPKEEASMAMEKCTLRLPRAVWREARIRALDEDKDFSDWWPMLWRCTSRPR